MAQGQLERHDALHTGEIEMTTQIEVIEPDVLVQNAALTGENMILLMELRRCRSALDAAIAKYPLLSAVDFVNGAERNTIGNLRAEIGAYLK